MTTIMSTQNFSPLMTFMMNRALPGSVKKKSIMQGIGRHSPHQVYNFCEKDCAALAQILGKYYAYNLLIF